jgi:hypothetical protein
LTEGLLFDTLETFGRSFRLGRETRAERGRNTRAERA